MFPPRFSCHGARRIFSWIEEMAEVHEHNSVPFRPVQHWQFGQRIAAHQFGAQLSLAPLLDRAAGVNFYVVVQGNGNFGFLFPLVRACIS
jgi:hypothetical protein